MKKTPFGAFLTPALTGRPPAEIRIERSLLRVARTFKRIYTTQTQPECEGGRNFSQSRRGLVYPTLSERRNIVVIADEAHRTQYDFVDGFARHMRDALPNASFIGSASSSTIVATQVLCSETRHGNEHVASFGNSTLVTMQGAEC